MYDLESIYDGGIRIIYVFIQVGVFILAVWIVRMICFVAVQ